MIVSQMTDRRNKNERRRAIDVNLALRNVRHITRVKIKVASLHFKSLEIVLSLE